MSTFKISLLAILFVAVASFFLVQSRNVNIFIKQATKSEFKDPALANTNTPLPALLDSMQLSSNDLWVLIDKSDYSLALKTSEKVVKSYPVVFGGNPMDDKREEGDQCTPEGTFHMIDKYPHRSWNKFIWLNYPTSESWNKHQEAKQSGNIAEDAAIGGEIGIHGVPKGNNDLVNKRINWTLGCISMRNDHLNEIYPYITKHTAITIRK